MSKTLKHKFEKFGKEAVLKVFLKIQKQIAEDMKKANAEEETRVENSSNENEKP